MKVVKDPADNTQLTEEERTEKARQDFLKKLEVINARYEKMLFIVNAVIAVAKCVVYAVIILWAITVFKWLFDGLKIYF